MGIFSFLAGGSRAADNVAETVRESAKSVFSIVDESFHTAQEKSEARQKAVETYCKIWEFTTKENTGTSVARRELADKLANFTLAAAALCGFAKLIGNDAAAADIVEIMNVFKIGWAFTAAVGFYFLTHVAQGIGGKK